MNRRMLGILGGVWLMMAVGGAGAWTAPFGTPEPCKLEDASLQGSYEGGCKDGKADGYGVAKGRDRYEGSFALGRPHGKGTYFWSDGERYDGEFLNGNVTGRGVYRYSNGDRYDGEFVDGQRSGKGVQTYKDGHVFDGTWRDNKPFKESEDQAMRKELESLRGEVSRLRQDQKSAPTPAPPPPPAPPPAPVVVQSAPSYSGPSCQSLCSSAQSTCYSQCEGLSDQIPPGMFGGTASPRMKCQQHCKWGYDDCKRGC